MDVKTLLQNTLAIVSHHSGSINLLDMLQNMRDYDDSTYTHCLNVALICNILAGWLKLSEEEVELATACGLFHDVGKMLILFHHCQARKTVRRRICHYEKASHVRLSAADVPGCERTREKCSTYAS